MSLCAYSSNGKVSKDHIPFLFMGPLTTLKPAQTLKFFETSVSIHQIVGSNISQHLNLPQHRILQYR